MLLKEDLFRMEKNANNIIITPEKFAEILVNAYHTGNLNELITLKGMLKYLENQLTSENL